VEDGIEENYLRIFFKSRANWVNGGRNSVNQYFLFIKESVQNTRPSNLLI
jgi:hypothetical protein